MPAISRKEDSDVCSEIYYNNLRNTCYKQDRVQRKKDRGGYSDIINTCYLQGHLIDKDSSCRCIYPTNTCFLQAVARVNT